MRKLKAKRKDVRIHQLISIYWKQDTEVLRACVSKHKSDIHEAITSKNYEESELYKLHLEAVKKVLLSRN